MMELRGRISGPGLQRLYDSMGTCSIITLNGRHRWGMIVGIESISDGCTRLSIERVPADGTIGVWLTDDVPPTLRIIAGYIERVAPPRVVITVDDITDEVSWPSSY